MGFEYVLISSAMPEELANETRINGEVFGVMTYNLATTLSNATASSTFKDVMDIVSSKVTAAYSTHATPSTCTSIRRTPNGCVSRMYSAGSSISRS